MKILICDAFAASLPEKLQKHGEVTDDIARLAEVDIALVRSKTKCTREWLDRASNLKLIIRGGVGLDNIDVAYAKEKGIEVSNTPEASSIAVAELAFALMLAIPNKLILAHNSMVEGKWLKKECERSELWGKVLGLVGIGRIAQEVAIRARAFGMETIACARSTTQSEAATIVSFDELLQRADYISLHTPLADTTRGMINRETIAKMKRGAILINTGRGACIVEQDVVDALQSGHLGGYGTDVWLSDPPGETPLLQAPNTVFAPHIGASTDENLLRIGEVIDRKIGEFIAR